MASTDTSPLVPVPCAVSRANNLRSQVAHDERNMEELDEPPDEEELEKAIEDEEKRIAERQAQTVDSDTEPDTDAEPPGAGPRGVGPPLTVGTFERARELCDGGGLCSLGRWPPERRPPIGSSRLRRLNEIIESTLDRWLEHEGKTAEEMFAQLAAGGTHQDPLPEQIRTEMRQRVDKLFEDAACDGKPNSSDLPMVLDCRLLQAILWEAGDPDRRGISVYYGGVRLGINHKMPRTPAIFARKKHWNLPEQWHADVRDEVPSTGAWRDNYATARAYADLIHQQLVDHHQRGLALRLPPVVARREFPGLTVMSLGAVAKVPEPARPEDVRILMDGTHGVAINTRIRQRDQDRSPTASDVKRYQRAQAEGVRRPRGLALDAQEAHRLPPVHPDDWRHLGCQARNSDDVFVYKYGVFGVSSSAYWWARLGGAILRAVHYAARPAQGLWILLMADDFKVESTAVNAEREVLWVILFLLLLRLPLAWRKIQGGDEISWIGYAVRCYNLSLGISASRAQWASDWLHRHARDGLACAAEYTAALGRLSFICGAMEYDRPFLSPLFAYKAKIGNSGIKVLPMFVRIVMRHLAQRFEQRRFYPSASTRLEGDSFRVDAKAEGRSIGVGGWLPARDKRGNLSKRLSSWFSLQIKEEDAPWAFINGEPYRAIASLEALAALIGVMVFSPSFPSLSDATITLTGYTDNRGNKYALSRLQSCKFPLCLLIMELASQLESKGARLSMTWAPRELNSEADALADGDYTGFDAARRIHFDLKTAEWIVLDRLLRVGLEFETHRRQLQSERTRRKHNNRKTAKKLGLRVTQPW